MLQFSLFYDAYVYNSYLKTYTRSDDENELKTRLDGIYHFVQSVSTQYDLFVETMRELKKYYLDAALKRFLRNPQAVQSEFEFERLKSNARAIMDDPSAPGMSLPSRIIQQALARPAREDAPGLSVAVRCMRREHTL